MRINRRIAWFAVVGGIGFIVDSGVMVALQMYAGLHPLQARPFSFLVAVTVTWYLNRTLTFSDRASTSRTKEWFRYFFVNGIGALINLAIFTVLVLLSSFMERNSVLALAVASLVAMFFNYVASKSIAFNENQRAGNTAAP